MPITATGDYEWHRLPKPLVTDCCGSMNWVSAMSEGQTRLENGRRGCDFCLTCMQPAKIRHITFAEWKQFSINKNLTEAEFENLWSKPQTPQTNESTAL